MSLEPPVDIQLEQALLGCMFMHHGAYDAVGGVVVPEHFSHPGHAFLWKIISTLAERGEDISPVKVGAFAEADADMKSLGVTRAYIASLMQSAPVVKEVRSYARHLANLWLQREGMAICQRYAAEFARVDYESPPTRLREQLEAELMSLSDVGGHAGLRPISDTLPRVLDEWEQAWKGEGAAGIKTGLIDLDNRLGGLHRSDLVILAGRPSMGKTALATTIAYNIARAGGSVALFSLEMSREQLAGRVLSGDAEVSGDAARRGKLDDALWGRVMDSSRRVSVMPIHIDDRPAASPAQVRSEARRMKRRRGLDLIVVDYLQLMSAGRKFDSAVQEVTFISKALKGIAKELDVPVLALSQLNRGVEQRDDKRPQLSDLRESGSIEQDADMVLFTYRPAYYLEREKPEQKATESPGAFCERYAKWEARFTEVQNLAQIIIGKQRHGPIGTVDVYFEPALTLFRNYHRSAA